jgi:hypothetical protein
MGDLGFGGFGDCGHVRMAGSGAWRIEIETYLHCIVTMWPELGDETRRSYERGVMRVQIRVSARAPGSRGNLC